MAANRSNGTNGKANGTSGNGNAHPPITHWSNDPRWAGVTRPYAYSDVLRLRGSIQIEHTLGRLGAERLWNLMHTEPSVRALGVTGNQAIEMVEAAPSDLRQRLASSGGQQHRGRGLS